VQGVLTNEPAWTPNAINGKAGVSFDGTNDYLVASSSTWTNNNYSYFAVFKKNGDAKTYHSVLMRAPSLTSATSSFQLISSNGTKVVQAESPGTGADALSTSLIGNTSDYCTISVTRQDKISSGTKLYMNGVLEGSSTASIITNAVGTTLQNFYVGGWYTSRAKISLAELLVYDRALTDAERQSVESGITQRYSAAEAIPDSLPDAWELSYFGNLTQNDSGDFDGDGIDNLTEYLQGRNPTKGNVTDTSGAVDLNVFTPLKK
jgi:trimeric autotransporter adhesin